jgi:ParB family chromosome partitioning protein
MVANTDRIGNGVKAEAGEATASWQWLPLAQIAFPEYQLRQSVEPEALQRLADTIQEHGMLEPLVVRQLETDRYELVAGLRRYRAAQKAGWETVPACVRELNDEAALELALQENLVREDLNPLEETDGILKLLAVKLHLDTDGVVSLLYWMRNQKISQFRRNVSPNPQVEIVESVFAPLSLTWKSFVETRLPLLKLPEDILVALRDGKIAYTKAKAIAKLSDAENRQLLLEEATSKKLSLSQIRARVRSLQEQPEPAQEEAEAEAEEATDSSSEEAVAEEAPAEEPSSEKLPMPMVRLQSTARRIQSAKLWKDPKRWQQAEKLLAQLEALVAEAERENQE